MIYDVFTIALIITLIVVGVKRGALRTLAGLLVNFFGYMLAMSISRMIAQYVYDTFIRPTIYDSVSQSLTDFTDHTVGNAVDSLPQFLRTLLKLSGSDVTESLSGPMETVSDTACASVDSAVQPVVVAVLGFLLTMLLFGLLSFVLRRLAVKPLIGLFERVPVIRGANRVLGGVIGFVNGLLVVSIIAGLLNLLLPYIKSNSTVFNESTIYNSYIFYYFYSGNIFTAVTSIFIR